MARKKKKKKSSKRLLKLCAAQLYRCHWCDNTIMPLKAISSIPKIKLTQSVVAWHSSGVIREARVATIDHVIGRANGGDSSPGNVVAACYDCNQKRGSGAYGPMPYKKNPGRIIMQGAWLLDEEHPKRLGERFRAKLVSGELNRPAF